MSLTPFLNRHAGETAWLFGKGPGLDHFDLNTAGPLRAAINDVAAHIPGCRYAFANDGVRDWCDAYRPEMVLFQPRRALDQWDSTLDDRVACSVVPYRDDWEDDLLQGDRETLADCLAVRRGTLGSALQVLHIMGVSRVVAVGIDGGNAHASGHQWRTRLRRDHWKDYNAIRDNAIRTAEILGLTLDFYQPENAMTDGKVKVTIKRSCFADGFNLQAGKDYDLPPSTAADLCAIGRAVRVEAPAKPAPETATLDTSSRETAAITKKTTKKKVARKSK